MAKKCNAPVFGPSHGLVCFLLWIAALPVIAVLIALAWIPGIRCLLKRLLYRLSKCTIGNKDMGVEL